MFKYIISFAKRYLIPRISNRFKHFTLFGYTFSTPQPNFSGLPNGFIGIQIHNAKSIIINHHPGKNPATPDIHNLRIIRRYKKALNIPVGLSCHYRGDEILYAAVGAGVNLIEKGVFDNPDEEDQNIVSTARLSELETIVRKVKNCWKALGKTEISVPEPRDTYTLLYGIVSRRKILKGEKISRETVKFAFPAAGISVEHWDIIKGRKVKQDISSKNPITWDDVNFGKK